MLRLVIAICVFLSSLSAQRVPANYLYHRVWAVVAMIGTGKGVDVQRPLFAPLASEIKSDRSGVLGWQMQLSDDGKFALVEFVGRTPADLQFIVQSKDPRILAVFEKGKSSKQDIERAFQRFKKNFSMTSFGVGVQ